MVTISHAAPHRINDAQQLMTAFFADKNIDYLSPQLHTQGIEAQNDFTENMGVKWADYANTNAAIIPSIVQANLYQNARDYFQKLGLNTKGFIQWSQTTSTPAPNPIPSPPSSTPSLTPSPTSNSTWEINKHYNVGDLVTYNSKQYKCLQEHDSVDPN
ncbi:carbohydrate-binding protein [Nostoc sp. PA-18-2419]|uniref:carbohydrate-binding protein n=1 Tax=Nostoc sp. PA-18-2419 TaxID=2575443 RepID=UPI001109A705|nr:carbohydrate-binding protein [Nostoc sp. PA-18-2419]